MRVQAFYVEDVASGVHHPPMFVAGKVQARRIFEEIVNDPSSMFGRHPKDFRLVYTGEWDDAVGHFFAVEHEVLAWAHEVKRPDVDPRQLALPGGAQMGLEE